MTTHPVMRVLGPVIAVLGCAGAYWGWTEIDFLRGTVLWEFRYPMLGIAVILGLSALEALLSLLPKGGVDG